MELYFDGYCPESLLNGEQVEMRLNEDDFWESEKTGLQMTVFPPYATILRWRGQKKFRQSSDTASNTYVGLFITMANHDEGKEIFPDEENIITDKLELEFYIDEIYATKEDFDAAKFNASDPVFDKQEEYLRSISTEDLNKLVQLFYTLKSEDSRINVKNSDVFKKLHSMVYNLKLIFSFDWMAWHKGWKNINDTTFDYSKSSLLELSMYLTAIFRNDRFTDISIEYYFKNGTLEKIFNNLV